MKQTPIPEKIITSDHPEMQGEHWMKHFNALIDVLTEQQKEIDELKNHVHIAHVNSLVGQTEAPYTAMRSTGECACKCHPTQYEEYGYSCQKCWGFHESKAHKPQEDVRVKIAILLHDEFDEVMDVRVMTYYQDIANKILAIVKGG